MDRCRFSYVSIESQHRLIDETGQPWAEHSGMLKTYAETSFATIGPIMIGENADDFIVGIRRREGTCK